MPDNSKTMLFRPLHELFPSYIIEYLKKNPANAMGCLDLTMPNGDVDWTFFIKADYSDVNFVVDDKQPKARFYIKEERVPYTPSGKVLLIGAEFKLGDAPLVNMSIVSPATNDVLHTSRVSGDSYRNETEFRWEAEQMLRDFLSVIKAPVWWFVFVDNESSHAFARKGFNNPFLEPDRIKERDEWCRKVEKYLRNNYRSS